MHLTLILILMTIINILIMFNQKKKKTYMEEIIQEEVRQDIRALKHGKAKQNPQLLGGRRKHKILSLLQFSPFQ